MRPPRWEYRTLTLDVSGWIHPRVDASEVDAAMNALGAEGWELVSALDVNSGHGRTSSLALMFKRARD